MATAAPIVGSLDENAEDLSPSAPGEDEPVPSQIKALPLVRKLAREMSIDLATVPITNGILSTSTRSEVSPNPWRLHKEVSHERHRDHQRHRAVG